LPSFLRPAPPTSRQRPLNAKQIQTATLAALMALCNVSHKLARVSHRWQDRDRDSFWLHFRLQL